MKYLNEKNANKQRNSKKRFRSFLNCILVNNKEIMYYNSFVQLIIQRLQSILIIRLGKSTLEDPTKWSLQWMKRRNWIHKIVKAIFNHWQRLGHSSNDRRFNSISSHSMYLFRSEIVALLFFSSLEMYLSRPILAIQNISYENL